MVTTASVVKNTTIENYVKQGLERIRKHPFIVQGNACRLTEIQAKRWIMCAGRESRSFPAILENLISKSTNPRIKEILSQNLADERGNGVPEHSHFMTFLHLLDTLEIPRDEFYAYKERSGINLALSLGYNLSVTASEAIALGYMLINESMTLITYSAARSVLTLYYPQMETHFFDIHINVDQDHVNEIYKAIEELDVSQLEDLFYGIDIGERGMAVLLDEAYGIFESCNVVP